MLCSLGDNFIWSVSTVKVYYGSFFFLEIFLIDGVPSAPFLVSSSLKDWHTNYVTFIVYKIVGASVYLICISSCIVVLELPKDSSMFSKFFVSVFSCLKNWYLNWYCCLLRESCSVYCHVVILIWITILKYITRFFYETLCTIWYHWHNLKNVENTHGVVFLLVKILLL